ncbi:MAG: GntR family transcriptional regulator [Gemmatimonadales bacterium]|nr:GntR family transcriptional regulator [Gemmatimonadales bacterium]
MAALLRQAIVSGTLAPGQRLRQEEISRQLGLSWTPVREAFRLLEAEGWLTIERHRGAVVAELSLTDFEEIYLLRIVNEPLAARLSAERMDDATLAVMEADFVRISRLDLSREDDRLEFLRLERVFHDRQYRAAHSRRLYDVVMSLRDAAERYLRASFAIADEPLQHRHVHQDVLAACHRRDGRAAEDRMRAALERVRARVRPLLAATLDGHEMHEESDF